VRLNPYIKIIIYTYTKKTSMILGLVYIISLPMLASAQSATSTTGAVPNVAKVTCVQNAIEKRDSSLIVGHNAFNTSIVNALTARKDALKSAYALSDKNAMKTAKKTAWSSFSSAQKSAHDSMRSIRKTSWNTFNTDMRACGVGHDEAPRATLNPTSSL
jgi:hypothetical protein